MKKPIWAILMLIVAVVAFGKAPGGSSDSVGMNSLLDADAGFGKALAAGQVHKAYLDFLAADGNIIAQGKPLIIGHEAIRVYVAEQPQRAFANWRPLRAGMSGVSDMGYTAGALEFSVKDADSNEKNGPGVYLLVWKKQDNTWKILALLINPARSAPPVAPDLRANSQLLLKNGTAASKADIDRARAAIIKTDSDVSALSKSKWAGEAFSSYIEENGVFLAFICTGLSGRGAIREAFGEKSSGGSLVWKPVKDEMSASCDLGFTIGYSRSTDTDGEGRPRVGHGHYLTVWKKQPDRSWKFILDGGNAAPPPDANA